jgi:hypothetical protein
MSDFYLDSEPQEAPKPKKSAKRKSSGGAPRDPESLMNIFTLVALGGALLYGLLVLTLLMNPYAFFNPFPPATAFPTPVIPTATWTPLFQIEPTWTRTPTLVPTETHTPRPTITPFPSATLFTLPSPTSRFTATRTPTATVTPRAPYNATVTPADSTIYHPEHTCNWTGVAGRVLDRNGNPVVPGPVVRLGGFFNGKTISEITVAGLAPIYGPSGFEFTLGTTPLDSKDLVWIQLLDQSSNPLSEQISLTTYSDCTKNLLIVQFRQVR